MYYNENKLAFKSWSRCLLRVITTGVLHVYMNDVQYLTRKFYMKRMTGVSRRHVYRSIWSYRKTYVYNIICSLHLLFDVFFVYIPIYYYIIKKLWSYYINAYMLGRGNDV